MASFTDSHRDAAGPLRSLAFRWAGVVALAETLAVGTAAVVWPTWEAIVCAIVAEALLLAALQRLVLRSARPGLEARWFVATVAGTLAGRGMHYALAPASAPIAGASAATQLAFGAALGALTGAVMALPQAYVLTDRIARHAWSWIAGRAIAWCAGFTLLMIASANVPLIVHLPIAAMLGTMIAGFAAVMALVGIIEGTFLARLLAPVISAHEAPPPRHGHPSECAVVVSRIVDAPAALVAAVVGEPAGYAETGAEATIAYRAASDAFDVSIAGAPNDAGVPEFDGRLRIDELDDRHARIVIVGRFAHRDAIGNDTHRVNVEERLSRELERVAERSSAAVA